jgi:serine-type D-Ala-D-Ala carboxypeptidase/endopeptidase (penicillin-binding protein 4)
MKKVCLACWLLMVSIADSTAQSVIDKLNTSISALEKDAQLQHGIVGFYVADAKTGKKVFERNSQIGLAPASTQKIIISVTAFELLGKNFRYKTRLGYSGKIEAGQLNGDFFIMGNGDPTLGSWRFETTQDEKTLKRFAEILQQNKINRIRGNIYIDESGFSIQSVPDGWIWQDIGNYYGAGSWGFNWKENQYDLILRPGSQVGDTTKIVNTRDELSNFSLINTITTGKKGSGDNGYIYLAPYSVSGITMGTIPIGKDFTISGSTPNPPLQFASQLQNIFNTQNIVIDKGFKFNISKYSVNAGWPSPETMIDSILSPPLDSINYWFLKKSINLYGEALIKTFAKEKFGFGSLDEGIAIVKNFWQQQGLEASAINIIDGSGLSPQNRVTPFALVKILQHARSRPWFQSFYDALPVYNGMKIKSGSIGGARSFAGYHTSTGGKEYVFAIIVNNYDGSSAEMVKKIFKVLDELK